MHTTYSLHENSLTKKVRL